MTEAFVRVALPRPVEDTFYYSVPEKLRDQIFPGSVVAVPFGKRNLTGVVTDLAGTSPVKTRDVLAVTDHPPLPEVIMDLAKWVASYYMSPIGMLLRLALPPLGTRASGFKYSLTDKEPKAENGLFAEILDSLSRGPRTSKYMEERFTSRELEEAVRQGFITMRSTSKIHDLSEATGTGYRRDEVSVTTLTDAQEAAKETINNLIKADQFDVAMLKGVTGSGKTEVYLRAASRALELNKGVLFLVPEISLTPLLTSRLEQIAPGKVTVLHSGMTNTERNVSWKLMRTGNSPLVVGVRSAVFAPIPDLGLIIVDEEHEASFRQEEMPSYNARDVAVKRGQMEEVPVILGSATPSLETYHNASTGRYHSIDLPERVTPSPDPEIILVDMASPDERDKSHPFLTKTLIKELKDNLEKGGQSILFLNRRGFAPFVLCEDCHEAVICPNCSVTLTYHRKKGMVCHYCAHNQAAPDVCPNCSSVSISPVGAGTQRLEDALTTSFPEAAIERLDRDALNKKGALEKMLTRMDKEEIQILVGTQILAKGHDFPGVTLAGILNAEQALDFPDFRSPERTFQIITQVSGRAGRGERRGKVVVQSYSTDHYAVSSALQGDYLSFYEKEAALRSELGYPPFGRMGRVIVEGANESKVSDAITKIAAAIKPTKSVRVLGPSPAPLSRIRNRHRWHFLVLAGTHSELSRALSRARREPPPGTRIHIRIDPYQLL